MRSWFRSITLSSLLSALVLLTWATAQESKPVQPTSNANILQTTALRLAPADTSVFSTSLRLKERLLGLWNTKAVQQIWKTPLVQAGWSEITKNFEQQAGPMTGFLEQKENKELLQLLLDMASEECFMLGGPTLPKFLTTAGEIFAAGYLGAIGTSFDPGADRAAGQLHAALTALKENINELKIPDLIVGFKVPDAKVAQRQVARLAVLLNAAALAVPQLPGNVKSQKINQFNLTTVTLDGAKMPWEMIPWKDIEEEAGEFKELIADLKKLKITISLGYYEGYVVLGFGESIKFLERLGQGKKLAELAEFKPLLNHLDKRITGVSYSNKEMNSGSGFTKDQADAMVEGWMKLLEESSLEDALRDRIEKDIKELGKDMLTMMGRDPGPAMSFSFQTARGEESFHYQYSVDPRIDFTKELDLLKHVGGDPILATLGRSVNKPEYWEIIVKWLKKGDSYFHEFGLPAIEQFGGKDTAEQVEKVLEDMYPFLRRLNETIKSNLIPALADGQSGFVVDNKLLSTQWHREMPASKSPLPLLEPAIIMGVSDRQKLIQSSVDVRTIFNGIAKYVHELQPDHIPSIHWPAPESMQIEEGNLYWYAFPDELQIDGRLKPSAGLSKNVCALTVSNEHALRLLQSKPLQIDGGPLADQSRKLGGATVFKMAGLVETAEPWVDYILQNPEMKEMQKHAKDVRTIMQSLKLFHTYSSATYLENKATVTHSEWRLKDLP
ncbi:MAG: hypothetical protein QM703_23575 [Gemmatales bacterium]